MINLISPGKVFLDYGPISMVISAWQNNVPMTDECISSCQTAIMELEQIANHLTELKKAWPLCKTEKLSESALLMWQKVKETNDENLTPLAAVAGIIADAVADWLVQKGATKVIVNNGGDIALRLCKEETTKVGLLPQIKTDKLSRTVSLKRDDGIGGIATSGLGGRSFTQGITEAVTVFADDCATADAFATFLANSSFLPSPRVKQVRAKCLDPNTDIPELFVTVEVEELLPEEKEKSLSQVQERTNKALEKQKIKGVMAYLQGETVMMPESFFENK